MKGAKLHISRMANLYTYQSFTDDSLNSEFQVLSNILVFRRYTVTMPPYVVIVTLIILLFDSWCYQRKIPVLVVG